MLYNVLINNTIVALKSPLWDELSPLWELAITYLGNNYHLFGMNYHLYGIAYKNLSTEGL